MKKLLLATLFSFLSGNLIAAEFSGKIQSIGAGPGLGSIVLIRVENHSASAPWAAAGCANGFWSFKFDTAVAGGKETYSQLLAAYTSQSTVVIEGTGTCPTTSGGLAQVQNLSYTRFAY
ncbi:MAG: hypothetical protein B0W54_16665 [Cellvibrio sp. 79]|nr:MAG: hypothetical protein B0W54_16665 [Cellvibrio sp. 79]